MYYFNYDNARISFSEKINEGNRNKDDVIKNTIEKSKEAFKSNYVINNLLLNLTYNFRLMKEQVIYHIEGGYISVFSIQIWIVFLSIIYYIARLLNIKMKIIIKFIGHLMWMFSLFIIFVLCCVLIGIYFIGSVSISLNEGIMLLKNKETFINQNNTYRCFISDKSKLDIPYFNKSYVFEDMDNIYNYLLQITLIEESDFYEYRKFLDVIEDYLNIINNPEYLFIRNENNFTYKYSLHDLDDYFHKIINSKSNFPLQSILNCSNPISLEIKFDRTSCNVPYSPFNKYDKLENSHCYDFNNVTIEEFTSIMKRYKLDTTCDTIKNNNEIFHLHEIAIKTFSQLKDFYEKYEKFYVHLYDNIILQ
jgi:hypothetical protein